MNLTKEHIGKRVKRKGNLGYDNVNDVLVNIDRSGNAEFSGGESYEATDRFGVWELVEEKKEHKMDRQKVLDAVNKLSCDKQAVITIIEEATGEKLKDVYTAADLTIGSLWVNPKGEKVILSRPWGMYSDACFVYVSGYAIGVQWKTADNANLLRQIEEFGLKKA